MNEKSAGMRNQLEWCFAACCSSYPASRLLQLAEVAVQHKLIQDIAATDIADMQKLATVTVLKWNVIKMPAKLTIEDLLSSLI